MASDSGNGVFLDSCLETLHSRECYISQLQAAGAPEIPLLVEVRSTDLMIDQPLISTGARRILHDVCGVLNWGGA